MTMYNSAGVIGCLMLALLQVVSGENTLWDEICNKDDLREFCLIADSQPETKSSLANSSLRFTVFAEIDNVFNSNPHRNLSTRGKDLLNHLVDVQVTEILNGQKWANNLIVKKSHLTANVYLTQFENEAGNFSYYINNGRICNQDLQSWMLRSQNAILYKLCTWMGDEPFPGSALDFLRFTDREFFKNKRYNNIGQTKLVDILLRLPDVAMVIFGQAAWNGQHTFFLPNNEAIDKIYKSPLIVDRQIMLAHVSAPNMVLFTEPWLNGFGQKEIPSIRFATNVIERNDRLTLSIKNLTDSTTGDWNLYAVSNVVESYTELKKGSVWAKVVTPNIPLDNGVAYIIDNVLGVVTKNVHEILMQDPKTTRLIELMRRVGDEVMNYTNDEAGSVTFFAPTNEAFDRIPETYKRELLNSNLETLAKVIRSHIVPGMALITNELKNVTSVNSLAGKFPLYFVKSESSTSDDLKYDIIGSGIKASIIQENVAATNGIIHFIDKVLGAPHETLKSIIHSDISLQTTCKAIEQSSDFMDILHSTRYRSKTLFAPSEEAWIKLEPHLRSQLFDSNNSDVLRLVLERHFVDITNIFVHHHLRDGPLREGRNHTLAGNGELILYLKDNAQVNIYWPHGGFSVQLDERKQIYATDGLIYKIDKVFVVAEDFIGDDDILKIGSNMTVIGNSGIEDGNNSSVAIA